jgi:hypothetical protein
MIGYATLGRKVNLDLVNEPELVNHPEQFIECAAARFLWMMRVALGQGEFASAFWT